MYRNIYNLRRFTLLLVTIFSMANLYGQVGSVYPEPARSLGLAGINTILDGSDAILANPSLLSKHEGFSYILGARNDFSLSELRQLFGGVAFSHGNKGTLGLRLSSYGFEEYRESLAQVLLSRKLSDKLGLAVALGMTDLTIEEFGNKRKFNFEITANGQVSSQLDFGVVVSNIESARLTENQKLVSRIAFGLRYLVSDQVRLYGQIESLSYDTANAIIGFEYHISEILILRSGYNISPGSISAGCTVRLPAKLYLDIGYNNNRLLGNSFAFSVKSALH